MKKDGVWFKKSRLINPLIAFYFFVAFIEIIAEYNRDYFIIACTKPFTLPILGTIYWIAAKQKNKYYLLALFIAFLANVLLATDIVPYKIVINFLFILLQFVIMYIVMQKIKFPGSNVVIIGSLPYFCICFLIAILFSKTIGLGFFLYIIQAALIIFLGGVSLGNYLTKNNKANSQLFVSTFLLSIAQLLVVASEYYFENNGAIAALTNVFFALGNYIFYLFVLGQEKKMKKYKIIN